jgi:hypothetical protein
MTIYKTEVQMPETGISDWIIYLALDESNPDNMSVIELRYGNALEVPTAVLITENARGCIYYDDMDYTLLRYNAEENYQSGMFTTRLSMYPTIELTVLIEQDRNNVYIEVKKETRDGNHTEDDADIQPE